MFKEERKVKERLASLTSTHSIELHGKDSIRKALMSSNSVTRVHYIMSCMLIQVNSLCGVGDVLLTPNYMGYIGMCCSIGYGFWDP